MATNKHANAAAAKAKKQKIILICRRRRIARAGRHPGPEADEAAARRAPPSPAEAVAATVAAVSVRPRRVAPRPPSGLGSAGQARGGRGRRDLARRHCRASEPGQLASFTPLRGQGSVRASRVDDERGVDRLARRRPRPRASDSATERRSAADGCDDPAAEPAAPDRVRDDHLDGEAAAAGGEADVPDGRTRCSCSSRSGRSRRRSASPAAAFDNGETVTLKLGKKLTLVNTATSVRYELKLVYTGIGAGDDRGLLERDDRPPTRAARRRLIVPRAAPPRRHAVIAQLATVALRSGVRRCRPSPTARSTHRVPSSPARSRRRTCPPPATR